MIGPEVGTLVERLRTGFARAFGPAAEPQIAIAPGRVNLIGEHTDYNDGWVLPMAIDRYVGVAFVPRSDGAIRAHAPDLGGSQSFGLSDLRPGTVEGWAAYVAGVAWAMQEEGMAPRGMDLLVRGEVPIGAGLSSSAALEMAVARAQVAAADLAWEPVRMAQIGQRAERDFVGVSSGIMDQFASAASDDGSALLLDCRSLRTEAVPMPAQVVTVVMDTGVQRTLAGSAYNQRVAECQEAVRVIRTRYPEVRALRDVNHERLAEFEKEMDPVAYKRACHVVNENERPGLLAEALRGGRLLRAGRLMNDSHRSLRDLYEVSCEELDHVVGLAGEHPACYGARLTGAGFGGCAVALVNRQGVRDFVQMVGEAYRDRYPQHRSALYACEASGGARLLEH